MLFKRSLGAIVLSSGEPANLKLDDRVRSLRFGMASQEFDEWYFRGWKDFRDLFVNISSRTRQADHMVDTYHPCGRGPAKSRTCHTRRTIRSFPNEQAS